MSNFYATGDYLYSQEQVDKYDMETDSFEYIYVEPHVIHLLSGELLIIITQDMEQMEFCIVREDNSIKSLSVVFDNESIQAVAKAHGVL